MWWWWGLITCNRLRDFLISDFHEAGNVYIIPDAWRRLKLNLNILIKSVGDKKEPHSSRRSLTVVDNVGN